MDICTPHPKYDEINIQAYISNRQQKGEMNSPPPQNQKEGLNYLACQIAKINGALQKLQREIESLNGLRGDVEKINLKMGVVDKKIKVVEVYQLHNLEQGRRLDQKCLLVQNIEGRIDIVQKEIEELVRGGGIEEEGKGDRGLRELQAKVCSIEEEIKSNRLKLTVLGKFKRQMSPQQCQSTKQISFQSKLQRKLRQFIMQRVRELQQKISQALPPVKQSQDYCSELQQAMQGLNRRTRVKQPKLYTSEGFINKMEEYYSNQQTQKNQRKGRDEERSERHVPKDNLKGHSKERSTKHKGLSGSSSKNSKNKRKGGTSSGKIKLQSVNQYLRLREFAPF